jgi:ATP-dependent RNA circularization protein (DNA/RNA ligase family)
MSYAVAAMTTFYRFPHTPHLAWLGNGPVRDDKILTPQEARAFLAQPVAIEEKVDGANIGFSLSPEGSLRIQQRGDYLQPPYNGQFSGLKTWLTLHGPDLEAFLQEPEHQGLILFGEWCAARHSVAYTHLPDPLLLFDVADPERQRFWSRHRRDAAAQLLGLATVPLLQDNSRHTVNGLRSEIDQFESRYHSGPPEGIILRRDDPQWCKGRAKLVRPDFTQAIEEHWSSRPIEWNGIDYSLALNR